MPTGRKRRSTPPISSSPPAASPDLDALDLDKARIRRDKTHADRLQLGASLKTSNPKIFAIGEAAGVSQPHAAMEQADLVLESALFGIAGRYDPALVPVIVATDPGIARIGLTEPEARARHRTGYSVLRASYAENDYARALRQTNGTVKLMVDPRGAILGAAIVGPGAAELIAFFAFAMAKDLSAARPRRLRRPPPDLCPPSPGNWARL